ncbi:FAD-binding oxidoreductase [Parasphingopyxis sp. CP4]|uniref:NAD(P)/FAD-dependent oxidoreductase n=1 Tax=Parasphingopyxis sp. CP4 TaxID=2724527 RepID=UPI0015A0CB13|nr:FAD-dependent oxidoreductase [Parasphingopyxis sp. CP4]QLC21780.1 FAD-binding oxidoreductase [Parasphingopyxis sp. CP4]
MSYDFLIIGAGIAGASLAAELAVDHKVLLLEAEAMPGYHSTGRSAAFWSETYGGPFVQPLTTASYDFLAKPDPDFSDAPFLSQRGALHIAEQSGRAALDALEGEFAGSGVTLEKLSGDAISRRCPGIRGHWDQALWEPTCSDIDVAGLHQSYLAAARRSGAELRCSAPVQRIEPDQQGWRVEAAGEEIEAAIVVNATGAWADQVAQLAGVEPVGVTPYRRTVIQLRTDPAVPLDLPLVIDVEGRFYFKGENGRLWLSPHDETPSEAGDVAAEELDVALAIDRFEKAMDWHVLGMDRKWAGLRNFAPDRLPIYGFDPDTPNFFWCAGQGGFGIQTAPAAAKLCRTLLLDETPPAIIDGVEPERYLPSRLR